MKTIAKFLLLAAAVWFGAEYLAGISVIDYKTALIAVVALSLVNFFVRPIVKLLAMPLNFISFGLFTFVINALMVMLMDHFVDGFAVASFWWALLFSVLISVVTSMVETVVKND